MADTELSDMVHAATGLSRTPNAGCCTLAAAVLLTACGFSNEVSCKCNDPEDGEHKGNHPGKDHAGHHCGLVPTNARIVNILEPARPGAGGRVTEDERHRAGRQRRRLPMRREASRLFNRRHGPHLHAGPDVARDRIRKTECDDRRGCHQRDLPR